MNADTLLENFEILAEAPDGINRLRELILQLATNGKLLKTSARNTNPATGLPETWMLQPFNEVAQFAMGKTPPTKNPDFWGGVNSIMWVSIGDMQDGQTIKESNKTVSLKAGREVFRREPWPEGTLLMSFKLTIGKMARLGNPSFFNEAIFAFDAGNEITNEYLFRVLPLISRSANSKGAIKGNTLNSESISQMRVPVPPLNEQERIVAKVDELMALCDQLEQQQKHRDNLRTATRKSAIDAISTATTPEELEAAWKRINNNWEVIADTSESVDHLKKLILANAASGAFLLDGPRTNFAGLKQTLGELCEIYQPKTISTRELIENGMHLVYGANGVIGRYDKFNHEFEEVLVTCRGATCGTVNVSVPKSWINGNAMVVRPKSNGLSKDYLAMILRGVDYASVITGTAQPQITRQPLSKISIFVPSVAEQKQIVAKVEELMAFCDLLDSGLKSRSELAEKFARSVVSAA